MRLIYTRTNKKAFFSLVMSGLLVLISLFSHLFVKEFLNTIIIHIGLITCLLLSVMFIPNSSNKEIGVFIFLFMTLTTFWHGAFKCQKVGYWTDSYYLFRQMRTPWDVETISLSLVYISVFQFSGLVGYFIREKYNGLYLFGRKDLISKLSQNLLIITVICAMLISIILQHGGSITGTINGLIGSRTLLSKKEDIGLLENFIWMGYFATSFFIIKLITDGFKKIDVCVIPFAILAMISIALDGTRHHSLYVVVPILLVILNIGLRINKKYLLGACVFCILFAVLYQAQLLSRTVGWTNISINDDNNESFQIQGADQYQALNYAIQLVPEKHEYFMVPVTPFFILHWIPSSFWSTKIYEPTAIYLSEKWTGGVEYTKLNITPSIIGQYHMNFGIFGVVWIGAFMGICFRFVTVVSNNMPIYGYNNAWTLMGMVFAFLIASFRHFSPLYSIFVVLGYVVFLLGTTKFTFR